MPLTRGTRRLLDADRIALLPRDASVINVGRGGTMDEAALLAALDAGHLDAAVLDVFEVEPLPGDHPFWAHPKVVLTPHCASTIAPDRLAEGLADILRCLDTGEPLPQRVDIARAF